ncbi:MAG TPA: Xaa-Pro peptidase family protein [bacterium]|nr:Xaa-Pro peptidase family protein [bacterium]
MTTAARRRRLRTRLRGERIDVCLITAPVSLRYFSGFIGSTGLLLVTARQATLFLDDRYLEKGRAEARGLTVLPLAGWQDALHQLAANAGRMLTVAFDEADTTVLQARRWQELFPELLWRSRGFALAPLRAVKERDELAAQREAGRRLARAWSAVRPQLAVGMSERQIAGLLDAAVLQHTGAPVPFETIVGSGPHAARPHHSPSDRVLQRGEALLIDMGAAWHGYSVDMTRMLALSPLPATVRRAWRVVAAAQRAALRACRAGVPPRALDLAARRVLRRAGMEAQFTHNLGHGVGLKVHEEPTVGARNHAPLQAGMVITVEPGVYFPGEFGIRIEDTVVVTAHGAEIITPVPREQP